MSEVKVNKISPRTNCGTVTLGDSGDTITVPAGVTITNNGTQTGFGRTGTVDWQTGSIKTTDFTAVNTQGFFVDTNSGEVNATLPAGSAGAIISFQDYRNTFDNNSLTITPNGTDKINGGAEGGVIKLSSKGEGVTLVYIDSTVGWRSVQDNNFSDIGSDFLIATGGTETTSGNCKIHTFTSPGTFTVCAVSKTPAENEVSYMVVAGGGSGGAGSKSSSHGGGGGGAGGYREVKTPITPYTASPLDGYPTSANRVTVTTTAFPITVGAGGTGPVSAPSPTQPGSGGSGSSSIFSTITSAGGGGGGNRSSGACTQNGAAGGSGGGEGGKGTCAVASAAAGNTPPTTPPQGNDGGFFSNPPVNFRAGAGGGGATAAGTAASPPSGAGGGQAGIAGPGGAGATSSINATPTARAGGGGGGSTSTSSGVSSQTGGTGGAGGGGAGMPYSACASATAGTTNTGGGGGGGTGPFTPGTPSVGGGANGGSGIVIIRYKFQQVEW